MRYLERSYCFFLFLLLPSSPFQGKLTVAKHQRRGVPGESLEVFQGLGGGFEDDFVESGLNFILFLIFVLLFLFLFLFFLIPVLIPSPLQATHGTKNPSFSLGLEDHRGFLVLFAAFFWRQGGKWIRFCPLL